MTKETIDTRLSYSSANLLRNCERRYYYYKVKEAQPDKDFNPDSSALVIGKAFHHVLEMSKHEKPKKIGNLLEECVQQFNLEETQAPLVHAMVLKYLRLHKTTNLECVACEYQIQDDVVNGFIDVIFKEKDSDNWWICDLKTSARLSNTLLPRLAQDRQLNLYAYFKDQVAKEFNLDPDKFMGCRYRVTTKSSAKIRANENYSDFVMRVADLVKSYDIIIPYSKMTPISIYKEHEELWKKSLSLRKGEVPSANYGYCDSYFKPCPYWSKCHGECFTDLNDSLEVIQL